MLEIIKENNEKNWREIALRLDDVTVKKPNNIKYLADGVSITKT